MTMNYHFFSDLGDQIQEIAADTIISRSLYSDSQVKAILFGFAPGQELSEHTSSRRAMLYFVKGDAQITLGSETMAAHAGTYVDMPPNLAHSILAKSEVVMLLLMVQGSGEE